MPVANSFSNPAGDIILSGWDEFQKQKGFLEAYSNSINSGAAQASANPFEQGWMNTNFNDMVSNGSANSAYYNMMMADPNSQYWSPYLEKYLDNAIARENTADARAWEEKMSNSAVQRSMADYKAAGLNPWLAVTQPASSSGVSAASTNMMDASTAQRTSQDRERYWAALMTKAMASSAKDVASSIADLVGTIGKFLF